MCTSDPAALTENIDTHNHNALLFYASEEYGQHRSSLGALETHTKIYIEFIVLHQSSLAQFSCSISTLIVLSF